MVSAAEPNHPPPYTKLALLILHAKVDMVGNVRLRTKIQSFFFYFTEIRFEFGIHQIRKVGQVCAVLFLAYAHMQYTIHALYFLRFSFQI
jgi:hypothetical protein